MTCKKCGKNNTDLASYCTQCGTPLGWICDCSFINQQENNFCGGCGTSLKDKKYNKKNFAGSFIQQYSRKQITDLLNESIYFKNRGDKKFDQSEIDHIFLSDKDSNE